MSVSVIIPVLNDAGALARTLQSTALANAGPSVQIIVCATESDRASLEPLQRQHANVRWIFSPRGRARQMNAGAAAADGRWLLFLHADTQLPSNWREAIANADRDPRVSIGCFRFALDSSSLWARVIELGVRLRVAAFRLPYGDQALFVRRDDFVAEGGYADIPIMEDVDLVRRFCRRGRLLCAANPVVTSARKWERDGWIRRTARHLRLIVLYFLGVTPERLAASL